MLRHLMPMLAAGLLLTGVLVGLHGIPSMQSLFQEAPADALGEAQADQLAIAWRPNRR